MAIRWMKTTSPSQRWQRKTVVWLVWMAIRNCFWLAETGYSKQDKLTLVTAASVADAYRVCKLGLTERSYRMYIQNVLSYTAIPVVSFFPVLSFPCHMCTSSLYPVSSPLHCIFVHLYVFVLVFSSAFQSMPVSLSDCAQWLCPCRYIAVLTFV